MKYEDLDSVFNYLANHRRRVLLACLDNDSTPILVEALGHQVAEYEADFAVKSLSEDEIQRVTVSLYHNHIPRLADANVIQYDSSTQEVAPGPRFEEATTILEEGVQMVEVVCEACGKRQTANIMEPHCKECGSDNVTQVEGG